MNNAVDAIERCDRRQDDPPPRIEIVTRLVDEMLEVVISDNGVGMTEEVLSRAFDPFFTTKDVGQGLGLAIAYQTIVDGHQGELSCESVSAQGTRFTMRLPIVV